MIIAKVVGTVVATRKDEKLVSTKLLVARPIDPRGKAEGNYLVAVDTVDAGYGETVLIVSGWTRRSFAPSSLRFFCVETTVPTTLAICISRP